MQTVCRKKSHTFVSLISKQLSIKINLKVQRWGGNKYRCSFYQFPRLYISVMTISRLSSMMLAWCGVKVKEGRILMVESPQPPRLIPRCFRLWRILSLVSIFLTSIAHRVPMPRELERTSGYLDSSSARPRRMVLPVLLTRSSKLSSRIVLITWKWKVNIKRLKDL